MVQFDVLDLPKANNSFFFVGVFVVAGGLFTAPRSLGHANVHIKVTMVMQFQYKDFKLLRNEYMTMLITFWTSGILGLRPY